jgi:hypothetical protein
MSAARWAGIWFSKGMVFCWGADIVGSHRMSTRVNPSVANGGKIHGLRSCKTVCNTVRDGQGASASEDDGLGREIRKT